MVSRTKTHAVESLLTRFTSASPPADHPDWMDPGEYSSTKFTPRTSAHTESSDFGPSLAAAQMSQTPASPTARPSSHGGEIVPYRPSSGEETLTQQDRRARADAGDLQARLDLIPLDAVEDQLSRRFRTAQPDCSILDSLRGLHGEVAGHIAASTVLEELADTTEQSALTSALVYRYVQAHDLWKDHPAAKSAEAFLDTLDNSDHVKANIVIGTSAQVSKWRNIRQIESAWGPDWFEKIPEHIRDPRWIRPEECSKRTLMQMVQNARRGYSIDESVQHWTAAMKLRTDEETRKQRHITSTRVPYIILDDVRSLNKAGGGGNDIQTDAVTPRDDYEDRLKVELVTPAAAPSKSKRKRCERQLRMSSEDEEDEGAWRVSADGKAMIKRVKNQIVRKPIEDAVPSQDSHTLQADRSTSSSSPAPDHREHSSTSPPCPGTRIARLLDKFVGLYDDIRSHDPDIVRVAGDCCVECRGHVLHVLASLKADVLPSMAALTLVESHVFHPPETSPRRQPTSRRHSIVVDETSDEG